MICFLTSSPSGSLDDSHKVIGLDESNHFVENLRKFWPDHAKSLMISAFPEDISSNDPMRAFFEDITKDAGLSLQCFDIWDDRTEDTSQRRLLEYDVIWLAGGHVPTQNAYFQKIHLMEHIRPFRGIVIGISAGTMNAAETVYAQPELDGESLDPNYQRFIPGLGLTKTNILPHYQMVRNNYLDGRRLFEDITYPNSMGKRFLALVDGSYLLSENGTETVYGEAYQISDGQIRQICRDGASVPWAQ